jgi:hypothetical protein
VAEQRPNLRVTRSVEGIGLWLKFSETILAPSPEDKITPCNFRVSSRDSYRLAQLGRRQLIFEFWSVVIGVPPPVPNVAARNRPLERDLTSLIEAHALFRGIKRPFAQDDDGGDVLAYILKPRNVYEYEPNMVSVASKILVPDDVVFVTYVCLDSVGDVPGPVRGTITHWGFVDADDPADLGHAHQDGDRGSQADRQSFLSLPY